MRDNEMKKVHFVLALHNHQPVGNFSEVFVHATEKAYAPWIKSIGEHPEIRWNLHMSGILWDWMKENFPSYIQKVEDLIKNGSLEILTGGYYEPILPILPDVDIIGQIHKLTSYIEEEFSYSPQGLWLAERVWEPHLPGVLNRAGIRYTVLDDRHFFEAGLNESDLNGYFVTEDQGRILYIFPVSHTLRYLVPFAEPEETIEYLRSKAVEGGDSVIVLADDGEKFGLWPGTYDRVYTHGWLERFIELLNENAGWIITSTFAEILRKFSPRSKIFIPSTSYFEMSEWALPYATGTEFEEVQQSLKKAHLFEKVQRFLKGGCWRNFLIRYPEADDMHKKMLLISEKVSRALEQEEITGKRRFLNAREHLWAGQCNCAYWHGVFGGIYLPHLRSAIYENLLAAEVLLKDNGEGYTHEVMDFRKSGRQEVLINGNEQNFYFAPAEGGTLFEWDLLKYRLNLSHVMTRRPEVYHRKIKNAMGNNTRSQRDDPVRSIHDMVVCKEDGLGEHIHYDWYRRTCFLDHFFHTSTTRENFSRCEYGEQGDFILSEYKWKVAEADRGLSLSLMREGNVWVDDVCCPVQVKKKFIFKNPTGIDVRYTIKNVGQHMIHCWFGYEMNFSFSEKSPHDMFEGNNITRWERMDKWLGIRLNFTCEKPCGLWTFPVETVSSAEDGFERTYQGTSVLVHWQITLEPGESIELPASFSIHEWPRDFISKEEISEFINR